MQEFKVGQKVKLLVGYYGSERCGPYEGDILEVKERCDSAGYWIDTKTVALSDVSEKEFEVVEDKPKRFTLGDRVISTKNTPEVPEGYVGFVVENDQSNYEYAVKDALGHTEYFNEDELELLSTSKHVSPDIVEAVTPSALDKQVSGSHYKDCGIQPIEYIHANGLNYFEGNSIKYITRHRKKNGKADLLKAIHYLELMIELEYPDE